MVLSFIINWKFSFVLTQNLDSEITMELVDPIFGHTGIHSRIYRVFHHQPLSIIFEEGSFIVKESICWLQLIVILEERKTACSDLRNFLWVSLRKEPLFGKLEGYWFLKPGQGNKSPKSYFMTTWTIHYPSNSRVVYKIIIWIYSTLPHTKTAQMTQVLMIKPWTRWWWAWVCLWQYNWGWSTSPSPVRRLCGRLLACWHHSWTQRSLELLGKIMYLTNLRQWLSSSLLFSHMQVIQLVHLKHTEWNNRSGFIYLWSFENTVPSLVSKV